MTSNYGGAGSAGAHTFGAAFGAPTTQSSGGSGPLEPHERELVASLANRVGNYAVLAFLGAIFTLGWDATHGFDALLATTASVVSMLVLAAFARRAWMALVRATLPHFQGAAMLIEALSELRKFYIAMAVTVAIGALRTSFVAYTMLSLHLQGAL